MHLFSVGNNYCLSVKVCCCFVWGTFGREAVAVFMILSLAFVFQSMTNWAFSWTWTQNCEYISIFFVSAVTIFFCKQLLHHMGGWLTEHMGLPHPMAAWQLELHCLHCAGCLGLRFATINFLMTDQEAMNVHVKPCLPVCSKCPILDRHLPNEKKCIKKNWKQEKCLSTSAIYLRCLELYDSFPFISLKNGYSCFCL